MTILCLTLFDCQYSNGMYDLNNDLNSSYNSYNFESNGRNSANSTSGSTALYHHNSSHYGLGMPGCSNGPNDKLNGLHGAKHKRGDMDHECERSILHHTRS